MIYIQILPSYNPGKLSVKIDLEAYLKRYKIKKPKETKQLSDTLARAQDALYERALEEIIEFCRETVSADIFNLCI